MAPSQTNTQAKINYRLLDQPIQSKHDNRTYKAAVLHNGLKVVAIHEEGLDKSCATLSVHVGHFCDPEDMQGTAHFLEHMLFLGTEKYPEEKEYFQYISANGGQCNAYTAEEYTTYYFDVSSEHFEGALDRLAQFFVTPLFTESATEREMNAVDSEHKKNTQHDDWRLHRLSRMMASKKHPLHKFGTGDLSTLNVDNARQRVIEFYQKYYSANLMSLVVYGCESVDELLEMASEKFSAVATNSSADIPRYTFPPFDSDNLSTIMYVKPVKDLKRITFTWQLPSLLEAYTKKSEEYITQLIGDEGQGSILQTLKTKNLATALRSSCKLNNDFSLFVVSIELTNEGEKNYWKIAEIVFAYISLLRSSPVQKWIMEEWKQLASIGFTYKEKMDPSDYGLAIAKNLHLYPSRHILNGDCVLENIDTDAIQSLLKELTPDNVQIMLISSYLSHELPIKHECFYNAPYQHQKIPSHQIKKLQKITAESFPSLSFPTANQFIPTKFDISGQIVAYENRQIEPKQLLKNVFWFKQDDTFGLPNVNVNVILQHSTLFNTNAKDNVLSLLFANCFENQQAYKYYPANLANLEFSIIPSVEGIEFRFKGLSDKLGYFIELVFADFLTFIPDESTFTSLKEYLQRHYRNYDSETPYLLAVYWMDHHLKQPSFSYPEKAEVFESLSYKDICKFSKKLSNENFGIKVLINGNYTEEDAFNVFGSISKFINRGAELQVTSFPSSVSINKLDTKSELSLFRPVENLNSAVEIFFECLPFEDVKIRALVKLYAQIFHDLFFHELRTLEQIGYVCQIHYRDDYDLTGVRYLVQSSSMNCEKIEERILAFIQSSSMTIEHSASFTEIFNQNVQGLKSHLTEKYKFITKETRKIWSQIINDQLNFTKNNDEAEALDSVSIDDLKEFANSYLLSTGKQRRMLSVWICGVNSKEVQINKRVFIHQ